MTRRIAALLAALALTLSAAAPAIAFDCIRVSSSLKGLQQSTAKSGNWLLFDLHDAAAVKSTLANTLGVPVTDAQAACVASNYAASGEPRYFALGIGVAGGKKTTTTSNGARAAAGAFGVLAWNNPNTRVLANNHGIDHLDDSGILAALFGAAGACGVQGPS
ncbi:MAG: hypothetical protein QOD53_2181 [Thermoleophilaceae bacterium]|nr:hypothetical protein [Thermoleophilaceae bacterium]